MAEEFQPPFLFLENVPAITSRGLEVVAGEISRLGYDCRWDIVSAADVGAPHLRKRWWLLAAHTERVKLRHEQGRGGRENREGTPVIGDDGETEHMADADRSRLEIRKPCQDSDEQPSSFRTDWWESEPDVDRVVNGLPYRVDRIKALGNSVVPQAAREAFCRLAGLK